MPVMEPGHEVDAPATDDPTPLPAQIDGLGGAVQSVPPPAPNEPVPAPPALPTAESVLQAIAATAANGPWFPARFAAQAGVPRDSLDEPLAELRLAGLVKVAEWVRGLGQGYELTPEGKTAADDPAAREQLKRARPAAPVQPAKLEPSPSDPTANEPNPRDADLTFAPPVVVPVLLMANVLWFFVCAVIGIRWGLTPARALSEGHKDVLHRFGAVHGADLLAGEWWRLVTCCFVHFGAFHLILNMLALAMMGPLAELLWGRGRLLVIYFVSGIAGSALAMALRPDSYLAGASGAIWGIQMSLFAWLFAFRRHLPPDIASDWFRRLFVVFVLNAAGSFLPGVSWEGHLGGGAAGFLAAGLLNAARFGDRSRRTSAWLLLALMPIMCVAGLAAAMDAKGMAGWQQLRQRLATEREASELVERKKKLQDAEAAFQAQVVPRADKLAPVRATRVTAGVVDLNVTPPELEAVLVLRAKNSPPARRAAARDSIRAQKANADEVVALTSGPPLGVEAFDRHRERVRAFAAARGRAFELLLVMLDAPNPPTPEAWGAWQSARADAEHLWSEFAPAPK